ncbi:MAG: right-handed parallel beta-helix repeat-containing protein [Candidatus Babeliales bacterium]
MKRFVYLIFFVIPNLVFAENLETQIELASNPINLDELLTQSIDNQFEITVQNTEVPQASCKGNCQLANQIQLTQNGISPNMITMPGPYCVITDLTVPAFQNGIFINTSNVILDLNNRIIMSANGANFTSLTGIVVNSNLSNITIRNGTIVNLGGNGILINPGCRQIILENIKFLNNLNGMQLLGVRTCRIQNCLSSFNRNDGFLIGSINGSFSQNFLIRNCISSFNAFDGFQLTSCFNCDLVDCFSFSNQANGFDQTLGRQINFNGCQALSNVREGFISTGNNHNFDQCQSNDNRLDGFLIDGNQQTITNCQAKANRTNGFMVRSNNNSLQNCIADANTQIGFIINGNSHVLENCEAKSNATGFQITNNNHCLLNNLAKNNTAIGFSLLAASNRCQVRSNTAVANSTGIQNSTTTVNRIYSNFSSDNTTANFVGVPNVIVSPSAVAAINFTANISN